MRPTPQIIELDDAQTEALLQRLEQGALSEDDQRIIRAVFESYFYVTDLIDQKNTSLGRLRKLLFGARSEKTADVVGRNQDVPEAAQEQAGPSGTEASAGPASPTEEASPPKKGHGRNGADDYPGALRIAVAHPSLQPGDPCPQCQRGTVYQVAQPGVLIRFVGQAPLQATIYELQKLRCHLCGKVFTAQPPAGVETEKYDVTVASMIGLLKYGSGLPFNRLQRLQEHLELPLPASTQWEIVSEAVPKLQPAYEELIRQAAQGEVVHNDDTTVKILELMGNQARAAAFAEAEEKKADGEPPQRKGLFTSGIVAMRGGCRIALFFSGRKHAGENLTEVLRARAAALPPPIQMCDALSRNLPDELQTIVANCIAHGRRQFVEIGERFPAECQVVLDAFRVVYANEAEARRREMSPAERLAFHQAESASKMNDLRTWLNRQFDERLVEPNSALGAAINYLRKHWEKLTLFLRVPGAPLDNNICERALKKAILHRKNALFYKTQNGAAVGDLYMSLIYTCELNGANPFDYLTQLQRHADEVAAAPAEWMPWSYHAHPAAA